jgi:hypothetical protein
VKKVSQRRSIWVGISIVVVFFAGVTLAVAWVGGGGPGVPHSVDGDRATCATCHPSDGLPDSHYDRVEESCRSCHSQKSSDASVHEGGQQSDERADGVSSRLRGAVSRRTAT